MKLYLAFILLCVICCQEDDNNELFIRFCKGTCQREKNLFRNQTEGNDVFIKCRDDCITRLNEDQKKWEEKKEAKKAERQQNMIKCNESCESLKKEGEEDDGRKTPYIRCLDNCRKPLPWKKNETEPEPDPEKPETTE